MKAVKRWRFYCDHCGKAGGSKGHMHAHEMRCFKNPERSCTMCGNADGSVRAEAIEYIHEHHTTETEAAIIEHVEREFFEGCPACTLSAIMGTSMTQFVPVGMDDDDEAEIPVFIAYDYKAKSAAYLAEKRRDWAAEVGGGF